MLQSASLPRPPLATARSAPRWPALGRALVAAGTLAGLAACSGAGSGAPALGDDQGFSPRTEQMEDTHQPGGTCKTPGEQTPCGWYERFYNECHWWSAGTEYCSDNHTWSDCRSELKFAVPVKGAGTR